MTAARAACGLQTDHQIELKALDVAVRAELRQDIECRYYTHRSVDCVLLTSRPCTYLIVDMLPTGAGEFINAFLWTDDFHRTLSNANVISDG